ncbi:pilus assembly protein [Acinetobacter junii]|uniref:Pilus assembly protein PilY n=1 Tax=Acinetobacter junii TaxID=40215 RepID=A0AAX1MK96_ACIJU|nr:hypothetical protein [Acinetobacter junii]QUY36902.1 hypothetical protein H2677_01450 [Acinetobacter junii]
MKTTVKIMAFKLSMLTTLMLCVSANNASDIEIYKAPNAADGKARVMLNLDNSTYMSGEPSGTTGPSTIENDFGPGLNCTPTTNNAEGNKKYFTGTQTRAGYTYNTSYCKISKENAETSPRRRAIETFCDLVTADEYHCYSRLTMLKRGVLDVINDVNLGSGVSIGFSFFPKHTASPADGSAVIKRPVPLAWYNPTTGAICDTAPYSGCINGRDELSQIVAGLRISRTNAGERNVRVAQSYGSSVYSLLTNSDGTDLHSDQCSGYGIFSLTSGIPDDDLMYGNHSTKGESAATQINRVMQTGFNLTSSQCSDSGSSSVDRSWQCIGNAADLLAASKARIAVPVKSVVVSFGTDFAFSPDLSEYDPKLTTEAMIQQVAAEILAAATPDQRVLYNAKRDAAISGVKGGGGYITVDEDHPLASTIKRFIEEVGDANIPFMTTGAPTIPQDPLNPVLVQSNAYFAQFKPTPLQVTTEGSSLWVGNMKKYHVNSLGRLVGKNSTVIGAAEEKEAVTDSLGRLITGTHDYWAPNVSSDETIAEADETVWGSELYARMGGAKSQLPLSTSVIDSVTVENRKLLTNRVIDSSTGVATNGSTLRRVNRSDWATNDQKRSDLLTLLDLRQLGAVMHSSPLLLSNEGKMTYDEEASEFVTSGREDYVLFGSVQGILHVVKADDYTTSNGGGKEVFAFVPNEMIDRQSKAFLTPDQSTGGTANLFYGIDAPWVAYTEYVPKADGTLTVGTGKVTTGSATLQGKQMVYGGLRMGGRSYYALDLKNMNDPRLKFHINPDAATTGPLSYMGESWSKPKLAWVKWQGSRKLVMFVGGGYDAGGTNGIGSKANNAGYESDTYDQTNGVGAGVYMFSADGDDAGDLLWWASSNVDATTNSLTNSGIIALKDSNMKYSVVSEIKTADRNNDGLVDHLYFGDLGGQVFRVDLNNNASTSGAFATRSTRILNMHESNGKSPRFYSAPSFAIFDDNASGNLFAAISIGSGNLSHPLAGYDSGRNYDALYTIYDKDVTRADLYTAITMNTNDTSVGNSNSLLALNEITISNRFQQTTTQMSAPIAPYASSAGWYYKLRGGTKIQQEKIFFSPTAIDYDLYVSSYDSSRLGLTGECGGGVQGVSKVQVFCMPFGQCSASEYSTRTENNYSDDHGPGIQNHTIASPGDGTTRLVGGTLTTNNLNDTYATRVKLIAQRWYER